MITHGRRDGRRVRLTLAFIAGMLGVAGLSIGLTPVASVGADTHIDPSLPTDPTTLPTVPPTEPPTTVPTAPPTTTTSAAPTTTTTRPPVITTRPSTTTTRASTPTTRAASRDTGGSAAAPTASGARAQTPARRRAIAATAARRAVRLRDTAGLPELSPTDGDQVPVEVSPRIATRPSARRQVPVDAPALDARPNQSAPGSNPMALIAALAGVAGLALIVLGARAVTRSRRDRSGALFVERDAREVELHAALSAMVADGPIDVSGSDCRALQRLVKVAALEGLEIRDPDGFVARASDRLVQAFGYESDRKRLPLHWKVTVGPRTVAIPEGAPFLLQETGAAGTGRRFAFAPGTPVDLWDGDCL